MPEEDLLSEKKHDARYVVKMGDVVLLKPLCCCGSSMSCRSVDAVFHSIWVNL